MGGCCVDLRPGPSRQCRRRLSRACQHTGTDVLVGPHGADLVNVCHTGSLIGTRSATFVNVCYTGSLIRTSRPHNTGPRPARGRVGARGPTSAQGRLPVRRLPGD
eukprot:scaffold99757_cov75-Phaeocystis_antarctica.AAC.4